MNPLDAARRLATTDDRQVRSRYDGCTECVFCLVKEDRGHAADCPLLALPRIVAALEAAERVVAAHEQRQARLTGEGLSPAASLGSYGMMHREVRDLCAVLRDAPR